MRMRSLRLLLVVALVVPLRSAEAQAAAPITLQPSADQMAALAQLQPQVLATSEALPPFVSVSSEHGSRHEGTVLMIVGVAGLITGLLVDESVLTVIGAGVAGVGLYFYLR
jgi:hypothetical protein